MSSGSACDDPGPRDDFRPTAPWPLLRLRADLLRRIRRFFDEREFLEVETPLLSGETVVDRHLDPIEVWLPDDVRQPDSGRRLWLQTSPELAMKRLLAAGGTRLYQITRSFRGGEIGRRHNPEFTIVEWYCADDSPAEAMERLSELAELALGRGPAERCSYQQAFQQYVGLDPLSATIAELREAVARHQLAAPAGWNDLDRDSWLNLLLAECVESRLGASRPVILHDFPPSQAALACVRPGPPAVAERFELYLDGVELANGYHELRDADELRQRIRTANQQRLADGKSALPAPARLLAAMEHGLPACCGVALGLDRLVMCAAGVDDIRQVQTFPLDRA